ncbi:Protein of unknown function [Pyronema omphalodes CBS 100304]|uniref:Uncharacterized protein n=1 Tax=Pyronema omphalodes (strain CBS 100304) TaxID=1076935 RepID=U4LUN7_PYROM|nr:Protein of unknown function [Pyronema omphalodes CBS 100304]
MHYSRLLSNDARSESNIIIIRGEVLS